jgi:di/tricarboxylate transporter
VTFDQGLVFSIITITLLLLGFQIWRYDLVALIGMLLLVLFRTISVEEAFSGFGHPAVVTIAAVLVISRGLQHTGVTEIIAKWTNKIGDRLAPQLIMLCGLVVISSAFMNNIAALAIFIPVAVRIARRSNRSPSLYLLPMAFSSHFGGLITLIGTPTNLIVSSLRMDYGGERFGMFAFAPVGIAIAVIGVTFISLAGWRLIPKNRGSISSNEKTLPLPDYIAEIIVPDNSELSDTRLHNIKEVTDSDIWVTTIIRDENKKFSPSSSDKIYAGDVLLVRGEAQSIEQFVKETNTVLTGSKSLKKENGQTEKHISAWQKLIDQLQSEDIDTIEAVVSPDSKTISKTAKELNLRARYGVNLLGISRSNEYLNTSLGQTKIATNDVLLIQTHHEDVPEILDRLGWLRLAERDIDLQPKNLISGLLIFLAALLSASFGLLDVPVAMTLAAVAMVLGGLLSLRDAYLHIEWPIIILMGAMLSMGAALEQTGGDQFIADQILNASGFLSPVMLLIIVLFITMMLSDIVNNAAAVVLMASISVSIARGLGVSTDPFLVAVAIGGACAFLTPIGHEANVLVFQVGGYKFSDYWKLGLPLEILITAVTVPILLWLWPL